jgi:hypothetical protein
MDITTPIETFTYLVHDAEISAHKTKTSTGNDIVYADVNYDIICDDIKFSDKVNIIDYCTIAEYNISCYTRTALKMLPKKEILLLLYTVEALNSTYWNVVIDIAQAEGYTKVIWVDGGLTQGTLYSHLYNLTVLHKTSNFFFNTLFRDGIGHSVNAMGEFKYRTKYFLSLARMARRERIYFTNKILKDESMREKGIFSCGWGDYSMKSMWNPESQWDSKNLKLILDAEQIKQYPVTLNHCDSQQHDFITNFDQCIFNVVMESSVGFDVRSHEHNYLLVSPMWGRVNSDRLFFTEKSAKPFSMLQLPLFIAPPGYVNQLRKLGFDMFDDIINHSYDKEDFIDKRCDMVFEELSRLINLHTLEGWNLMMKTQLTTRLNHNYDRLRKLASKNNLIQWINSNF